MKYFILLILNLSYLFSEEDSTKIYWNSLSTDVTVGVPIADDESLERGRIQVKVSFDDGKTYNINADTAAGAIASSLKSKRLLILTDVKGVMDSDQNLIKEVDEEKIAKMIDTGEVSGGMIPKINTCLDSVKDGVDAAVIVDGRVKHAVLLELFTDHGAGTLIR